ncbi:DegV family protein [uncultured Eubacterium sp.]|uniref:DegV family protein n=1 Tax=uncultured Eubacterium sp. TaxID=165185 RepID=UPI002670E5A1|nr:DegV family protein [uncultured Eubacterium sp.]
MKTAVLIDSNAGIKKDEAKELGIYLVSTPIIIDGEVYFEEENLTQEQFYEALMSDKDITSSMPSPGDVMDMWDELLKEYDEVAYIPLSSGLSNSCHAAVQLSDEYDGKVQVVDDHRISVTMRQSALDAKWMADNGKSAKEIKEALEQNAYNSAIYLTVEDLKYLKKGGRVTPAAAALGAVLNIKPVLATKGGKFDAVEKVRGMKKSIAKLLDYTEQTLDKLIEKNNVSQIRIGVAGTFLNQEDADNWYNMVKDRFIDIENIEYDPLSLVVAVHTGPNAAGIGISVILRDE